jgi:iron complex transport system substrate-binding protein
MRHRFLAIAVAIAAAASPAVADGLLSWQDVAVAPVRIGTVAYPRSAIDAMGKSIVFEAPPKRIVSLEYEIDEYLYRIVPPSRVVGVSRYAYEKNASNVLAQVHAYRPPVAGDIETVLRLEPDLVLAAARSRPAMVQALMQAGVRVFRLPTLATELNQVAEIISVIGYLTGEDDAARREGERFEGEIAQVASQCARAHPAARIFGVSMIGYTYGDRTLFQDVVRLVGAVNVAAQNGIRTYEKVGNETVLRWNPDWVFTWSDPGGAEAERRRWIDDPALGAVAAIGKHQLVVSDGKDFLPLSSEATKLARILANALCQDAP